MAPKEVTARCQQAIDKASIHDIKLQGINKLINGIRVRCETEEQAKQLHIIDWNEAFEGAKIHRPNYAIVIRGIPIDDLGLEESKAIEAIEAANKFPNGTISKITPLRGKNNEPSSKYRSIIAYLNDYHTTNKCITKGCYINYAHYYAVWFAPQFQVTQCFKCYEYGHLAGSCKGNPRCGKCGGKHNTKECNSTIVQCVHCKDSHEAWRHECPAWITERHRLGELWERSRLFTV